MLGKLFNRNGDQHQDNKIDDLNSDNTYINSSHNLKFEVSVPDSIKERNRKLLDAYLGIINTIKKIQGWLDDEELRTRIESDFRNKPSIKSTIYQCTTQFCVVSIGCDGDGCYNIIYSVDYRIKEMISPMFASILIRRIYDFTPGEMEPFVNIGSLYEDCVVIFNKIFTEELNESFHKIITMDKHTL